MLSTRGGNVGLWVWDASGKGAPQADRSRRGSRQRPRAPVPLDRREAHPLPGPARGRAAALHEDRARDAADRDARVAEDAARGRSRRRASSTAACPSISRSESRAGSSPSTPPPGASRRSSPTTTRTRGSSRRADGRSPSAGRSASTRRAPTSRCASRRPGPTRSRSSGSAAAFSRRTGRCRRDVLKDSLRWSPDGSEVAFFAFGENRANRAAPLPRRVRDRARLGDRPRRSRRGARDPRAPAARVDGVRRPPLSRRAAREGRAAGPDGAPRLVDRRPGTARRAA